MLKVVYFDEGSATDLISIKNGGNLIEATIQEKKTGNTVKGHATGGVAAGKGIRRLLNTFLVDVNGEIKFDGELFRDKSNIVNTSLSNTILTDFISLAKRQRKTIKEIEKLEGYQIEIVKDSIAYYQRVSPFLVLTDGKVDIADGINININKLHDTLKIGKGYYELIAYKDQREVVLRFNNSVFRNNYSVSDLDQMNLVFYGIKVGKLNKELLNFETLMNMYSDLNDIALTEELRKGINTPSLGEQGTSNELLEVYDVILAGVE